MGPAVKEQRFQVVAAKADVGGCRLAMDDATELFPLWVKNIDSARATAIHVSDRVDLPAIRGAGLGTGEVRKYPVGRIWPRRKSSI
jgi:hypothetical protein